MIKLKFYDSGLKIDSSLIHIFKSPSPEHTHTHTHTQKENKASNTETITPAHSETHLSRARGSSFGSELHINNLLACINCPKLHTLLIISSSSSSSFHICKQTTIKIVCMLYLLT